VSFERLDPEEAQRASPVATPSVLSTLAANAAPAASTMTADALLGLQASAGNAAVTRLLSEADASKAKRAVARRPADQILTNTAASKTGTVANAYGTFTYAVIKNAGSNGCSFNLSFQAFSPEIASTKITFIQTVKGHKAAGAPFYLNNDSAYYAPFDPDGSGLYTDHLPGETDPFYNYEDKTSSDETTGTTGPTATTMADGPKIGSIAGERGQTFETAPFALSGTDKGEFFGTLTWGWDIDAAGTFKLQDVAAHDDVSTAFGSSLRKFIAREHDINKTGATPAAVSVEMPAQLCRDLTAAEALSLKPTVDYVKAHAGARIWVVGTYTDAKNAIGSKDNAAGIQQHFVNAGVAADKVRHTYLEQAGVKKDTTAIEITVIDT
jgi:hypothetical protein